MEREFISMELGSSLGKNGFIFMKVDFPVLFKVRDKALLHHEATVQDTIIKKKQYRARKTKQTKKHHKRNQTKTQQTPKPHQTQREKHFDKYEK